MMYLTFLIEGPPGTGNDLYQLLLTTHQFQFAMIEVLDFQVKIHFAFLPFL